MNRVSLVCTVHEESGQATVSELCAILEHIQPEVIFLEVPPEAFKDFYGNSSRQNLESIAVRHYCEGHAVKLVPLDLPTPEREFFESHEQLHNFTRDVSPRYRQLIQSESYHVKVYGFAYLNGEHYCKHRFDIDQEMVNAIRRTGDSSLIAFWQLWSETLIRRENAMMENILRYCRENAFNTGAFLVGAAHRQAIIEKSRAQTAVDSTKIQWDFADWMS